MPVSAVSNGEPCLHHAGIVGLGDIEMVWRLSLLMSSVEASQRTRSLSRCCTPRSYLLSVPGADQRAFPTKPVQRPEFTSRADLLILLLQLRPDRGSWPELTSGEVRLAGGTSAFLRVKRMNTCRSADIARRET